MSVEEGIKDFEVGLFAIIISLIFGIVAYFVLLFTKAYPPFDIEITVKKIGTLTLSTFSPLTVSLISMGIIDLSAF